MWKRFYSKNYEKITSQYGNPIKTPLRMKPLELPRPVYGGKHMVTFLPGIGKGPELFLHVKEVLDALHAPVSFEEIPSDPKNPEKFLDLVITSIRRNGTALKGELGAETMSVDLPLNVELRAKLDLYVSLTRFITYGDVPKGKHKNVDVFVIKQNTEGEFAMLEHENVSGVVENMKIITRDNTKRLAKWAFNFLDYHKRKRVTIVHKMRDAPISDTLFVRTVQEISENYKNISINTEAVDKCCRRLVMNPQIFDTIISPNLYGDIAINVLTGILGGSNFYSTANYSDRCAVFEAAAQPLAADISTPSPIALLNATTDLLNHLRLNRHAEMLHNAVLTTLLHDRLRTQDEGGTHTAADVIANIIRFIALQESDYRLRL